MTQNTPKTSRPLSPHMQIYKWHITMVISILHRITGVALVVGTALLVAWLWSAAYSASCHAGINAFLSGLCGKTLLFGWTVAFYFHFCNGIRHLFWDAGKGFEITKAERTAWAVLIATAIFSACTWIPLLTGAN